MPCPIGVLIPLLQGVSRRPAPNQALPLVFSPSSLLFFWNLSVRLWDLELIRPGAAKHATVRWPARSVGIGPTRTLRSAEYFPATRVLAKLLDQLRRNAPTRREDVRIRVSS
jgi:hypothetical protein